MSLLFNKEKKSFKKNVFNLVDYCYNLALKANGVYVAENKKTIVLYYEKKKLKKSFGDYYRYLKVAKGISIFNLAAVLRSEKEIQNHKIKLDNYIYVWFIAQKEGYGKLDGLQEINQMLFTMSHKTNLPIVFETSDTKLIKYYKHIGYDVYKELERGDETVYFLADQDTVAQYRKENPD